MTAQLILIFFLFLVSMGAWEMFRHRWYRRRLPIRVHVNGSRGKSSVARLIAAGLRHGGMRTFAKTTGSAARCIHPDGSETPVIRRGGPNIREQLGIFREAVNEGAEALVLECMAVRPDLQWTTEHRIVKATHGVITNIRPDHLEAMGPRLEDVAESLSSTVPKHSRCYAAEPRFGDFLRRRSVELETEFRHVAPDEVSREEMEGFSYIELPDNVALALAVCLDLGIDRETALAGMRAVEPDPGALVPMIIQEGDREIEFLNLFAANDPESTAYLWQHLGLGERGDQSMALVNIRADRMRRSKDLAPLFGRQIRAARYLLVGELTGVFADMLHRNGVPKDAIVDMGGKSPEYVWTRILTLAGEGRTSVVGLANIGGAGFELMKLFEEKGRAA